MSQSRDVMIPPHVNEPISNARPTPLAPRRKPTRTAPIFGRFTSCLGILAQLTVAESVLERDSLQQKLQSPHQEHRSFARRSCKGYDVPTESSAENGHGNAFESITYSIPSDARIPVSSARRWAGTKTTDCPRYRTPSLHTNPTYRYSLPSTWIVRPKRNDQRRYYAERPRLSTSQVTRNPVPRTSCLPLRT